jgi:hypothetical protein
MQAYTGCIAGALTRDEFTDALTAAGLTDITIAETHRVHTAAASANVRATKPDPGSRSTTIQASCREHPRRTAAATPHRPTAAGAGAGASSWLPVLTRGCRTNLVCPVGPVDFWDASELHRL